MMNTMSSESKKQKRLSEETCKELYAKYETPERVIRQSLKIMERLQLIYLNQLDTCRKQMLLETI